MVKKIDAHGINRRTALTGLAGLGSLALTPPAAAQMVLRPPASGTDRRYVRYSQAGPYTGGENAKIIAIPDLGFKAAVHIPRLREARLVVFSHGALADPQTYRPLLAQWASHGFVVVAPIHDDSIIEKGLTARRDDAHTGTSWDISRLLGEPDAWEQRATMCSDILNATETLSRLTGCRFVADRAIIIGHDYGAYVAELLLGMTAQGDKDRIIKLTDTRYAGGILLSPQGTGVMGLNDQSWNEIDRPYLTVIAGGEVDANGQDAQKKMEPFLKTSLPYKHLAVEIDAEPQFFTGQQAITSERQGQMFDDLKAVTTAFLLAYAGHDEAAFKDLYGDWFAIATSQRMEIRSR